MFFHLIILWREGAVEGGARQRDTETPQPRDTAAGAQCSFVSLIRLSRSSLSFVSLERNARSSHLILFVSSCSSHNYMAALRSRLHYNISIFLHSPK